ncbi:phosphonate ABC transporter, permease protein PhnE [Tabrizicola sp. TH137]|uniref:phosphonate ABC transporter, permease protein PhnE n=1 Tax=Tabrizicola sp. TH137 TaxID=2067452 RepID=UPI000C7ADBFC|nr:phosphonate ABC transporter, permease protein PhnE [Tabrizicola sp. TH137]PLL12516.1 phosphonate ABC transporter, permease protein PhnE [Tabrizicola sp. TH137]
MTYSLTDFDRDYREHRRRSRMVFWSAALLLAVLTWVTSALSGFFKVTQYTLPDGSREEGWVIPAGLPRLGEYLSKTIPELRWESLLADIANWFGRGAIWAELLLETVLIGFLATLFGVIGGLLLSFVASRNLSPAPWMLWVSRRSLEIMRTVPELVWALIFVFCFGVGPMAGVLAISIHAAGALGKLYSEANENIDMRPVEGVKAAGGSWADQMRWGVFPQVLPNVISYTLLRFEINVRSSSIIGYVGAGGLGQELRTAISLQEYTNLSALFLIIFATVIVIDWASERIRHRIIGIVTA